MLSLRRPLLGHAFAILPCLLAACGGAAASPTDTSSDAADESGSQDASATEATTDATLPLPTNLLIEPASGIAPIYAFVQSAKTSIDMTMYELTDTTMTSLLTTAASHGVTVRVILDQNLEKKDNTKAFNALTAGGVQVHWANPSFAATHQKTITIDGATSAIMTLNFTPEFYKSGREFVVIDANSADVAAIEQTFGEDFTNVNDVPPTGSDLVWSPTNSSAAMLGLINAASTSLQIENEEMSDTNVVTALSNAAKRGVSVAVTMTASPSWDANFTLLKAAGVKVGTYAANASLYIHAKVIVADAGTSAASAFVGSENFSNASLTENRELGLIVTDPTIVAPIAATLTSDFAGATPY